MTILVVGASGATGRRLVEELLHRGHNVRVIVRSPDRIPDSIKDHDHLSVVCANLLDLTDEEMAAHTAGCEAVASCLGHNMTFKGIYGHPRRLVTEAVQRLCAAIRSHQAGSAVKFVLMNTVAYRNPDLDKVSSLSQRIMIRLLRLMLPPHSDNEMAAEYLRTDIGQRDTAIEWVAVRPSALIDEEKTSEIEAYAYPMRSIFKDGKISRINVGYFMADLITEDGAWQQWKGQMPVIYNKGTLEE